jgi:hypothetical protein
MYFCQRAVPAEADQHLVLADAGLDVDVGGALLVGVDDDFVDQLDQLVVGGRGNIIATALTLAHLVLVEG